MVTLEKAPSGSADRTLAREAEVGLGGPGWVILSTFPFGSRLRAGAEGEQGPAVGQRPPLSEENWMVTPPRQLLLGS